MIPKELYRRTNYIFKTMGGAAGAAEVLSTAQILDTVLFNGYVLIIEPYLSYPSESNQDEVEVDYTSLSFSHLRAESEFGEYEHDYSKDYHIGSVFQSKEEYNSSLLGSLSPGMYFNPFSDEYDAVSSKQTKVGELYDLEIMGYIPRQYYYVLDESMHFIYRDRAPKMRVESKSSSYFGFTFKDRRFIYSSKHGKVFYIYFDSFAGPQIARAIINNRANPAKYSGWLRKTKALSNAEKARSFNEFILRVGEGLDEVTVHLLERSIKEDCSATRIAHSNDSQQVRSSLGKDIYIKTNKSFWFLARVYLEVLDPLTDLIVGSSIGKIEELLLDRNFREVNNWSSLNTRNSTLLFYKETDNEEILELKLEIDNEGVCYDVKEYRSKALKLKVIEGENLECAVFVDGHRIYLESQGTSRYNSIRASFPLGKSLNPRQLARDSYYIVAEVISD